MSTFKKCQVVMFPTNEKASIHSYMYKLGLRDKPIETYKMNGNNQISYAQHLYILSDEEVKEGDWVYCSNGNIKQITKDNLGDKFIENWKKIIATTNKLNIHPNIADSYRSGNWLPQPSQSFIEKYVEQYNKGNQIVDLLVGYEEEYWAARNQFNPNSIDFKVYTLEDKEKYQGVMFDYHPVKLKINSKDNTITIKKVKESWNRDEVAALLNSLYVEFAAYPIMNIDLKNKWIEENL